MTSSFFRNRWSSERFSSRPSKTTTTGQGATRPANHRNNAIRKMFDSSSYHNRKIISKKIWFLLLSLFLLSSYHWHYYYHDPWMTRLFQIAQVNVGESKNLVTSGTMKKLSQEGEIQMDPTSTNNSLIIIQLIVAYCNFNLEWIHKDVILSTLQTYPKASFHVHIMSKCGKEDEIPDFQSKQHHNAIHSVTVHSLPNVGGCDYAYAKFLKDYTINTLLVSPPDHHQSQTQILLFLKDTPRTRQYFHQAIFNVFKGYRPILDMLDMAIHGQFACGLETHSKYSEYHDVPTLYNFTKGGYTRVTDKRQPRIRIQHTNTETMKEEDSFNAHMYMDLKDFHSRALHYTFPRLDYIQVCYGGAFAIPQSRLVSLLKKDSNDLVQLFKSMEESTMESKMSIAEHFIERTWAGLLAPPLSDEDAKSLKSYVTGIFKVDGAIYGVVQVRETPE